MKTQKTMAALLLFVAAALMTGSAIAADFDNNDSESSTVDVTVSSTIAVDVKPDSLTYSNAEVGSQNTSSDTSFTSVEIENVGSEHIDRIWLNNTAPSTDPFGTGSASNYDAGNFLQVKVPNDPNVAGVRSETDWHFINRKEFLRTKNSSAMSGNSYTGDIPSYVKAPLDTTYTAPDSSTFSATAVDVGRLRFGNESAFFAIPRDAGDTCDGSGSAFLRVGNVSQTDTRLGTVDFKPSSSNYRDYPIQTDSSASYGVSGSGTTSGVTINLSSGTRSYDVLVKCDTSSERPHIFANRYNVNTNGADDLYTLGSNTDFVLRTDTAGDMLLPGDAITIDTSVHVPNGVAQGSVGQGKLRVLVRADTSP